MMVLGLVFLPRKDDIISFEKEASGLCLFHKLHGVQVVGCSKVRVVDKIGMTL
jgi:hypothetical protein